MNEMNWTESPMHEKDSTAASHKHTKHSSAMVRMADRQLSK